MFNIYQGKLLECPQYLKNNWTTTCMNTFLAITLMDLKINNAEHENVVEFKMLVSKVSYQNWQFLKL